MGGRITAEDLTVSFDALVAVDHLELDLEAGVVFGFLGPNGAGKSTTIRLLLGLLQPDSGRASINGFDVATQGDDARAQCGVLLDDDGLYDRMTAVENLEFAGRIALMTPADRRARTAELLDHMDLTDRGNERVGQWSLGMRKKLAVARAMYHRPPVVFLDEPTNGLDPLARKALRADIVTLARGNGATVFVTTHDIDDAQRMCDLVGVMVKGRLVTTGSPDAVRAGSGSATVELRGTGFSDAVADAIRAVASVATVTAVNAGLDVTLRTADAPAAPVVAAAVTAGAGIEQVSRADSTLEDAFVELVHDTENEPVGGGTA